MSQLDDARLLDLWSAAVKAAENAAPEAVGSALRDAVEARTEGL